MTEIRRTVSGRLMQVAAAGALAALAGLAGVLATGAAAASTSHVARKAPEPAWRMQAPPEPAGTTAQVFGDVSCSSSSACMAIAINDFPHNDAIGNFAESWNGSHWTVRTVPHGKGKVYLYAVRCRSARWCMAVGAIPAFPPTGPNYVPVADRWNGRAWTQVNPPAPASATTSELTAVACSGTTACTAIGQDQRPTGTPPRVLADRWNGSAWKIQPVAAPPAGGLLDAIACPAAHACRAVGSDTTGLFSEAWNGAKWVVRPVPVPAGGSSAGLTGISCTATNSCEAVGTYEQGGTFLPLAEVWNGSRWRAQASPAVPGATSAGLDTVSCVSATDCEAGGDAATTAGTQVALLEKWNGTRWSVQKKVLPAGDSSARLSGISCTTGPVCEAVGFHGKVVAGNHLLALRYSS